MRLHACSIDQCEGTPRRTGGRAQSAVKGRSNAGWFEGRTKIGRVGRERGNRTREARGIFDRDRVGLRCKRCDMRHAMATMRRRSGIIHLASDVATRLRNRDCRRALVAVKTAAMEKREHQRKRDQRDECATQDTRAFGAEVSCKVCRHKAS